MRVFVLLLFSLWLSRLVGLQALPLHNDEGLHLTRAIEVWNLHPFWEIHDGKIINHWVIALFYPQNEPVFVGRIATLFISVIGFAAGYALVRRLFGANTALFSSMLWIASPYLYFFERLALSDAEAGALIVLALWTSWLLTERATIRHAVLAGFALGLAALFKFTAAPFALSGVLVVLVLASYPLRKRILLLITAGLTVIVLFIPPIAYVLLRGDDMFSVAFGWVGSGAARQSNIPANLNMLAAQLTDFGVPVWSGLMLVGLVLLVALRPRMGGVFVLAVCLPLAIIIALGREVLPRHYVAALPALLILGGAGIGTALERWLKTSIQRRAALAVTAGALAIGIVPFARTASTAPEQLRVPRAVWTQYFSEHSAGYGLREAVRALPQMISPADVPVVASMTADSCRRANFYAVQGMKLVCANAPGLDEIASKLAIQGMVYVLIDKFTGIEDVMSEAATLNAEAEQIAVYARPGADGQPVSLWKLTRQ